MRETLEFSWANGTYGILVMLLLSRRADMITPIGRTTHTLTFPPDLEGSTFIRVI